MIKEMVLCYNLTADEYEKTMKEIARLLKI